MGKAFIQCILFVDKVRYQNGKSILLYMIVDVVLRLDISDRLKRFRKYKFMIDVVQLKSQYNIDLKYENRVELKIQL